MGALWPAWAYRAQSGFKHLGRKLLPVRDAEGQAAIGAQLASTALVVPLEPQSRSGTAAMRLCQYITSEQIAAYEAKGWNVVQCGGHHGRFYLAWREDD